MNRKLKPTGLRFRDSELEKADFGPIEGIDPKILGVLSPEQIRYVLWETTPDFFKPDNVLTLAQFAKSIGVCKDTLNHWRVNPYVIRAFAAFGMYVVKSGIADRQVFENLVELTKTDTKAQEIYWKLRGALSDKPTPVEFNGLTIDARQIMVGANSLIERFNEQIADMPKQLSDPNSASGAFELAESS